MVHRKNRGEYWCVRCVCVSPLTVQSSAQTTSPLGSTFCLCGNSKSIVKVTFAPVKVGESLATLNSTRPPAQRRQVDSDTDSYTGRDLKPQRSNVFVPKHFTPLLSYNWQTERHFFPLILLPFQESLYRESPSFQIGYILVFHDG